MVAVLVLFVGPATDGYFPNREAIMSQSTPADWTLADSKIITTDQARLILSRAKEWAQKNPVWQRDYEWFAIAVQTGLRISEVGHIEKWDVLPSRLMVTRRKKKHLHPTPIDVMPEIHDILQARADAVESGYIFPGNAGPCFIHRQSKKSGPHIDQVCIGGHAALRTIQGHWRLLLEDLGLYQPGRGVHSLRHTAITNVYALTKDIRKAQVFAGHSSSVITERYAHILDMRETLAQMPAIL